MIFPAKYSKLDFVVPCGTNKYCRECNNSIYISNYGSDSWF